MKHDFPLIAYDIDALFDGTNKLSTFMHRLRDQSKENSLLFDPDKYMGLGFECMIESLITQFASDTRIFVRDYTPIQDNDWGVDGIGYGPGGETHTVQCKARSDNTRYLNDRDDHISNFVAHSCTKYKAQYLTVFTTAAGINRDLMVKMYDNQVRCINNQDIRLLVDKNRMFWQEFRDQMKLRKAHKNA
jgi:hypothetical protein